MATNEFPARPESRPAIYAYTDWLFPKAPGCGHTAR
jgi:hypothetical protein